MSDFPMRPHIPLEWRPSQQQIVAKQSLIGLSWNSLVAGSSSTEDLQRLNRYLADVAEVPEEIFTLADLQQVLSLQTWNSCLSEAERQFLYRFLPEICDVDETVTALLGCNNLFFGNTLTRWSELVCSGSMHPDSIVKQQITISNERKSYYSSLRTYHQTMIQNLQQLKDLWKASGTPERIHTETERWLRSRKPAALSLQHPVNGEIVDDVQVPRQQRPKRRREYPVEKSNSAVEQAMQEWYKNQIRSGDGDGLSTDARTITVTRKQFAEIANRKLAGTDLRIDNLKDLLSSSTTKFQSPDELFKSYWHNLAARDLPEFYKGFKEKFLRRKELAIILARQCMHRRSKVEENLAGAVTARSKITSIVPNPCSVSSRFIPEKPACNGSKIDAQGLLYYQRVGVATEDDELASIQELWSYNCLQDAPIHL